MNDRTFATGNIIVSRLHPKIGEVVGRDRTKRGLMVCMRYLNGIVVHVPIRLVRHATAEEIAEYNRRKSAAP